MNVDAFAPRRCCGCNEIKTTCRNIAMLNVKAPVPGTGWACVVCHLPPDGAIALMCDDCNEDPNAEVRWVIAGDMESEARVPIDELEQPHRHDHHFHPEMVAQMN